MLCINEWYWEDKTETGSTNDDAVEKSRNGIGKKFIISAVSQTKGRGRRGRNWLGAEGNLFFSQGLECELKDVGQLVCVSALSLYEAVAEILPPEHKVEIKWPNDILIDGKKICGTLLEKGHGRYFVIGIGVNVRYAPVSPELVYQITCLSDCGINIDRISFLRSYIAKFDKNHYIWQQSGFSEIKTAWKQAVKGLGEKINVRTEKSEISGIFYDIGDNGELLLQKDEKISGIFAGDVFFIDERR